jgi:hypothetical protein
MGSRQASSSHLAWYPFLHEFRTLCIAHMDETVFLGNFERYYSYYDVSGQFSQ